MRLIFATNAFDSILFVDDLKKYSQCLKIHLYKHLNQRFQKLCI